MLIYIMSNFTLPIGTKKIFFVKSEIKDEVTEQKKKFCSYYETEIKKNKLKHDDNYNAYLFHINKLFFIIDVDSEPAFNYVISLIEKHDLEKKIQSTKSISNYKKVNNYKYHLYFKNNLNIENNKSIGKLELFVDKIITEDSKRFNNNIKLNDLPELTQEFYNDLLSYKPPKEEIKKPKQEEQEGPQKPQEEIKPKINKNSINLEINDLDEKDKKILELVNILDIWRADDYNNWFNVGRCLYNTNNEYINIFNEFSKRSSNKYESSKIIKIWADYKKYNKKADKALTLGTLRFYANEDNKEDYLKWCSKYKYNIKMRYDTIKTNFEINNFFIKNPVMYGTINFEGELKLRNETEFKTLHQRIKYIGINPITGEDEEKSFIMAWLYDETARQYEKLEFLPKQETPTIFYNSFNGFEVEKQHERDIKLNFEDSNLYILLNHLCGNDPKVVNYVLKWIANRVQKPYEITKVALLFKSLQGAGKNLFWDWVGKSIIGQKYFFDTEKIDLVFGRFNGLIENIILGIINETSGKDTFNIIELIKGLITADDNMIEHKGMKPYKNKNHIGLVFLTNNSNSINIPSDDRRFVGIKCNSDICNDPVFFPKVVQEIKSKKYDRCFYDYLMNLNIDGYDFTNERPKTSFYNDMVELNRPILTNFMLYLYHTQTEEATGATLFNMFSIYLQQMNIVNKLSGTKFGINLKDYEGITKNKSHGVMKYKINKSVLKEYLIKKCSVDPDEFECESTGFINDDSIKSNNNKSDFDLDFID